jgi:hypothetical protein
MMRIVAAVVLLVTVTLPGFGPVLRWGEDGHLMTGRAAAEALPEEMPAFFRAATAQLSYLNPEPDRWRDRRERDLDRAMDNFHSPEHYINFEGVPEGAFLAIDRYAYIDSLRAHGHTGSIPGYLPFTIIEMTQRLRVGFRAWREATDPGTRAFIEQRIINDAGILGHYVADGANPHHTSIHHNGWVGDNPRGFTTQRGFHSRFESVYVRNNIVIAEVREAFTAAPVVFEHIRPAVFDYLRTSHSHLERLYELDLVEAFGPDTQGAEHRAFTVDRLAAGAAMLRDLWWSAWVTSEG